MKKLNKFSPWKALYMGAVLINKGSGSEKVNPEAELVIHVGHHTYKGQAGQEGQEKCQHQLLQKLVLGEFFKDLHGDVLEKAGPLHLYFYSARYSLILQWWRGGVGRNNRDKKTQSSIN